MKNEEWVKREVKFAYPDNDGITEMLSFELFARKEDAEKLDKYLNIIHSGLIAIGGKAIPIYDYQGVEKE